MNSEALARAVIAKLRSAGHKAWLVGGCVRDLLLGCQPKDFDVATDARPDRIMDLFPNSGRVGAHFGVVLVRDLLSQVEVATFRSDHDYEDGRHPGAVHFESDPREDVLRRDFTINGLLMDPDTGEVLDYVGGRADLEAGVVRAIGDPAARFREDHLRMLRAIRFAARLNFRIDPATFDAIRANHRLILRVSAERIRDEIVRILTEGGARRGFEMLDASGLLDDILPEVAAMKGVEQPPEYHPEGDVWTHTLLLLEQLDHPSATLALGALLHDVGKPPTFRVAERIRFDGHVEEGVRFGARYSCPAALLPRTDGAGGGAGGESHEIQGCAADEREHAETLSAAAVFRRAPRTAPARLPVQQQTAGELSSWCGRNSPRCRRSI